ncbi:MAG: betaine/proline/choline family ABC transporter ATP-binding protein [Actinobacteria bacterium]|nr:betaine/proline/choline family ABC transporter ATP-binding protein [Actinomycetota bacterium]
MITLENLTKTFAGQKEPAVKDLSMEVPEGEIVVLVGPSGCGKTTTMRLVNRLIEPDSGKIYLEGEDVTSVDSDQLRRRIGYVIQQIGLFPHMTIGENIATVPHLVGWDNKKTSDRIDELLNMVGMDPTDYRNRYPKELSGGQKQRIGVARAMAADPSVMLMDEPFGAVDPITRSKLQNEFLRLQEGIKKTIIFVTHDIDEAIKMGDRIAILRDHSTIAQYDKPENILLNPADDFVASFIGTGASLKRLNLAKLGDVELVDWPTAKLEAGADEARAVLDRSDKEWVLLLDEQRHPQRWVNGDHLAQGNGALEDSGVPATSTAIMDTTLSSALADMLTSENSTVIVIDSDGAYQGVADLPTITKATKAMRVEAHGGEGHDAIEEHGEDKEDASAGRLKDAEA